MRLCLLCHKHCINYYESYWLFYKPVKSFFYCLHANVFKNIRNKINKTSARFKFVLYILNKWLALKIRKRKKVICRDRNGMTVLMTFFIDSSILFNNVKSLVCFSVGRKEDQLFSFYTGVKHTSSIRVVLPRH